jgi:hypothetical protein
MKEVDMKERRKTAKRGRRRGVPAGIAALIFVFSAAGLAAQDIGGAVDKLVRLLDAVKSPEGKSLRLAANADVAAFLKAAAELQKIDARLGSLKAGFSFGYTGDRSYSGDSIRDSNHLLNVDTNIVKDRYPSALKFRTSSKLLLSKGSLQNESSTILLSLNHYLLPFLEGYVFTEKFSDSFMSIKQRYEMGAGFKFEYNFDPIRSDPAVNPVQALEALTPPGAGAPPRAIRRAVELAEKRLMDLFPSLEEGLLRALKQAGVSSDDLTVIFSCLEAVERAYGRIDTALAKDRSWLNVGIAFSAFSEVEQNEIAPYYYTPTGQKVSKSYLLDPEQRFRFVIRPSVEWFIADGVSLTSMLYVKLPLGAPYTKLIILDPENPSQKTRYYDWRVDSNTDLKFNLGRNLSWGGDISLTLEYQYHFDNAPPGLPESLGGVTFLGMGLKNTVAATSHQFYMVKFNVGF